MEHDATKRQILERADMQLGREELARRLNVPPALVESWIGGYAAIPDGKLMVLACLLDKPDAAR
jgi:hypothetical protein